MGIGELLLVLLGSSFFMAGIYFYVDTFENSRNFTPDHGAIRLLGSLTAIVAGMFIIGHKLL